MTDLQRCPEREDQFHEWLHCAVPEGTELDLQCVRCGAVGYTCPECEGWGCLYGDDDHGRDFMAECEVCKGRRGIAVDRGAAIAPFDLETLAMCVGELSWDQWGAQRSGAVGRLVDLGLIRAEEGGGKVQIHPTEAGKVVRWLAVENAKMLAALQAVRNFGSRGETDEGISVSYLVESAIAKASASPAPPPAAGPGGDEGR